MAKANVYMNFNGNTRDVLEFYKSIFGGETEIMPIAGSPMEEHFPADKRDGVLHGELNAPGVRIMSSDMAGPDGLKVGNNLSMMLDCESEDEINKLYAALSADGGNQTYPIHDAFWGAKFGHLKDKFGIDWSLNYTLPKKD